MSVFLLPASPADTRRRAIRVVEVVTVIVKDGYLCEADNWQILATVKLDVIEHWHELSKFQSVLFLHLIH